MSDTLKESNYTWRDALQECKESLGETYQLGVKALGDLAYSEFVPRQISSRKERSDVMSRTMANMRLFAKTIGGSCALAYGLRSDDHFYSAIGGYLFLDGLLTLNFWVKDSLKRGQTAGLCEQPATVVVELFYKAWKEIKERSK